MTRFAAFLRGVNLGRRTVKSTELKTTFEAMGFADVKTLLASGNVLFDTRSARGLKDKIEAGLGEQFGFAIPVVLRAIDELKAMVAADPFGRKEGEDAKLYAMLFDEPLPATLRLAGIKNDFDITRTTAREVFLTAWRKPDGTYGAGGLLTIEKQLPKGTLVTTRNWNTILKAIA
jgi:uncharacterized protein (DUF1697 family)